MSSEKKSASDLLQKYFASQKRENSSDIVKFWSLILLPEHGRSLCQAFYDGEIQFVNGLIRIRAKSVDLEYPMGHSLQFHCDCHIGVYPYPNRIFTDDRNSTFFLREEYHFLPKWPWEKFLSKKETKVLVYKEIIRRFVRHEFMTSITNVQSLLEDTNQKNGNRTIEDFYFPAREIFALEDGTIIENPNKK